MSFDPDCSKLLYHKIINAVIAYVNVSRLNAIRLIKSRNINSLDQVESSFKSLAYKGWDLRNLDSISVRGQSQPPIVMVGVNRAASSHGHKSKSKKKSYIPLRISSRLVSCIESILLRTVSGISYLHN